MLASLRSLFPFADFIVKHHASDLFLSYNYLAFSIFCSYSSFFNLMMQFHSKVIIYLSIIRIADVYCSVTVSW